MPFFCGHLPRLNGFRFADQPNKHSKCICDKKVGGLATSPVTFPRDFWPRNQTTSAAPQPPAGQQLHVLQDRRKTHEVRTTLSGSQSTRECDGSGAVQPAARCRQVAPVGLLKSDEWHGRMLYDQCPREGQLPLKMMAPFWDRGSRSIYAGSSMWTRILQLDNGNGHFWRKKPLSLKTSVWGCNKNGNTSQEDFYTGFIAGSDDTAEFFIIFLNKTLESN